MHASFYFKKKKKKKKKKKNRSNRSRPLCFFPLRQLALAARLLDEGDEGGSSSLGDVAGVLSRLHPAGQRDATAAAKGAASSQQKKKLGATKSDPVAERRKAKVRRYDRSLLFALS
jgi:hypothetical protein